MQNIFDYNQKQRKNAIILLKNKGCWNQATYLCWSYTRHNIFRDLSEKKIKYRSTDQAIKEFFLLGYPDEIYEATYLLYTISTMADWDGNYLVSEIDFKQIIKNFNIIDHFFNN